MSRRPGVVGRLTRDLAAVVGAVRGTGNARDIQVVGYRGFGTPSEVFVSGRVLLGRSLAPAAETDPWWRNLANTYRRMESDEVPGAHVRVRIGDAVRDAVSVDEGFFRTWLKPTAPLPADRLWHRVELELLDGRGATGVTHVLTPPPDAAFGIISDLDDTVVRTDATNLLRMMRGVLFSNARTRLPFEGVAAFYQALHRGASDAAANPIFYVSSSPWNLYDALVEFLEHRDIPMGPLLLRDWNVRRGSALPTGHRSHKLDVIRQVLDAFPTLPFLLLGDSGQQDPEIYAEVVAEYPERIRGIYIRDVTGHAARRASISELAHQVHEAGSVLVLAEDTVAAARHAAGNGWISASAIDGIRAERARAHAPGRSPPEHEPIVLD